MLKITGLAAACIIAAACFAAAEKTTAITPANPAHPGEGAVADTTKSKILAAQKTCPVTGEAIERQFYTEFHGKRIFACMPSCLEKIKKDPEKYIQILAARGEGGEGVETIKSEKSVKTDSKSAGDLKNKDMKMAADSTRKKAPEAVVYYTCSMHPKIHQATPGNCHICGMKLIPEKAK
jgi:YHS domain-containing protein